MCDSAGDSASDCSGISPADEDRVRSLFFACDYNGDGFIDGSDLEMICRELDLGSCVQELLIELGADHSGRVSYGDFLRRRKALRGEIAALKDGVYSGGESSQDLPETSTSGNSLKKQEKWEWDSGARDLESPETLEIPVPAPSDAMAELASTLHLAAVSSLKNEVLELSSRLHAAHRQRDIAKEALASSQNECDKLRNQVLTYEERLTELHGVIAELRRSNAAQNRNAIPELGEEESELETSYREPSEVSEGGGSEHTTSDSPRHAERSMSPAALPIPGQLQSSPDHEQHLAGYVADSTSMEDEVLEVVEKRKFTNERSRRKPPSERGRLSADIPERPVHYSPRVQARSDGMRGSPQMKVASRVRLRKTNEDTRLTGKDICQEGVFSSAVAEHLTRSSLRRHDDFYDEDCGLEGGRDDERMIARMDRLEADNALLSATLKESKQHADRLSLACAQCSAEAGALRIALAAADRAVEAYDVLLALAETKQTEEGAQMRSATERVARQFLSKLEAEAAGLHQVEAGPGPWADAASMLVYNDNLDDAWSNEDEQRLRNHVSRLKRERSVAASSAQPAPWPLQDDNDGTDEGISSSRNSEKLRSLEPADARRMDMETAVLMQEVMSLREERAELRARLRAARHCAGLSTNPATNEDAECERRLLEALARENTLKTRLQRLMSSLHQHNDDLKKHGCHRCVSSNKNADSGKEASDDTGNPEVAAAMETPIQ